MWNPDTLISKTALSKDWERWDDSELLCGHCRWIWLCWCDDIIICVWAGFYIAVGLYTQQRQAIRAFSASPKTFQLPSSPSWPPAVHCGPTAAQPRTGKTYGGWRGRQRRSLGPQCPPWETYSLTDFKRRPEKSASRPHTWDMPGFPNSPLERGSALSDPEPQDCTTPSSRPSKPSHDPDSAHLTWTDTKHTHTHVQQSYPHPSSFPSLPVKKNLNTAKPLIIQHLS